MIRAAVLTCALLLPGVLRADDPKPLKILFLGDNGHHRPAERFRQLQPVLARRGIDLVYTDKVTVLQPQSLAAYDGLAIYANTTQISPEQEKALLDYVAGGKGLIPLHCASYCFLNSPRYIELVGAQFQRHGTGTFGTELVNPGHPILKGFRGFTSWDETYVHTKHNEKDRTVLEVRAEGNRKEPWTWVRTHGKGRVFYTAWGHDERTWGHPGFQSLVERGIRWAVGGDPSAVPAYGDQPEMTQLRKDVQPFRYADATVPFYPPSPRWGTVREPLKKMQLPLPPDESMKHVVHPVGFTLKRFADESILGGKPLFLNWDERGRLWVVLTYDYPNEMQPEGQGRDRIVVCDDSDGDGKADKVTIFADKLSIPTSFTFANGGVVVTQAPHTLFLKDTDGDGVADVRKVLFTGWGTRDTHAGPSNLHYGLDNWVYGIVGYSGFDGTVGGTRHRFAQGFFRFRPDGSKMEFLRNTNNNSWGVGFSEEGYLFGSTANGCPSVYLPIPNRYYESVRGWSSSVLQNIAPDNKFHPVTEKVRQVDWHGGFTAGAGHALYTARAYPPEYWNRTAFVNEPTGHLAATFILQPQGADFKARYGWNLVASDDEWYAPIMAEVGPDGNVWILDWYNFIVQHNPTPPGFRTGRGNAYETELRDKKHGRIYRLVHGQGGDVKPVALTPDKPESLVAALQSDNLFWRRHAQRLLVERGKDDVVPALVRLTQNRSVDAIGLNPGAIHALWTLHGLGALAKDAAPAVQALKHPSAGVRRNAAAVLPRQEQATKAILESGVLNDPDAQVRLAALLALAEQAPSPEAAQAVAAALARSDNVTDRWIPDALTSAAAAHDVHFLKAVAAGKTALAERGLQVVATVAEHYARGGPGATIGSVISSLGGSEAKATDAILAGLIKGWPTGRPAELNEATEKALADLLPKLSTGGKGNLLRLAALWGSKGFERQAEEITRALLATLTDDKQSDAQRSGAARQLVEFRSTDDNVVKQLLDLVTPRTSPQLAAGVIDSLGLSTSTAVGRATIERLNSLPPTARAAAFRMLLARPTTTRALLDALERGTAQLGELTLDQKQALTAHPDRQLAGRARRLLERGGSLPSADRQKVLDGLLDLTRKKGDAAAGKAMFTKHCAACHTHGGEGNRIGPDLTGMAVHSKEHLLTDIIDPSRSVEGNYRVYTVATQDGRVLTGLLASETRTSVELIDAQAQKQVVLRDNIDQLVASTKSLMPEGFEKQMTPDEVSNLLEFLTQRGKYLPLPLGKAATVVSTRGMFYSAEAAAERLVFRDWAPKTFEGVPFVLVDPQGERIPNAILLYGPTGSIPPKMPKSVTLPCNAPAKAVHLLSGVSGWGYPATEKGTVSLVVRLHYADGQTEEHPLRNGEHFADYIRRVDVPGSKFAFALRGQQIRYLAITPRRPDPIKEIELVKGPDATAPVVLAVTVEGP